MSRSLPHMEIRLATIDDLADIFHLGEAIFTAGELSNLYRTWDEYEVTGQFHTEGEHMLVADIDGHIVGFAMGTVIQKARSAWSYGHLLWLGVAPGVARRGVASRLFERFRELMVEQGVRLLMVDTQADNRAALRFFRRKGFENPTDHVYMTLNIEKQDG